MENDERSLLELCELKPSEWTLQDLKRQHRILRDVSPWLNAQGNAIHHQIIDEICRRGPCPDENTF